MQATSFEPSNFAQTAVVSLATVVALALLGLVLAYWTWAWFAPAAEPRALDAAQARGAGGSALAAQGLFGSAGTRNGAAPAGTAVSLLGVVAASAGQSGYAVLRLDAKQTVAVREGEEIEPGLRLAEVQAGRVVLERNGMRETLGLPERPAPAAVAAPASRK